MKLSPPLSLLLLAGVGVISAQDLTCPEDGMSVQSFDLPSGDGCILCVPSMDTCGVKCSCPTTACDTYSCELTPPGCGTVICSSGEPEEPDELFCTMDVMECPDGSFVDRDPENDCEFRPCPEEEEEREEPSVGACTLDVMECPDGSFVDRDPENDCEFRPCPSTLPEVTCEMGGETYLPGDTFMDTDDCNQCTCGDNGMAACTMMICPDEEDDVREDEEGVPSVLPECEACTGPDGMCYAVGEEWTLEDGCSVCTCVEDGGECVGCPPVVLPETGNTVVEQEGDDCNGINVEVGCVLMSDEDVACADYVPTDGSGCNVEVKYTYYARQAAPPTDVILTSVIRTRDDSDHGSPRDIAGNRWGQNLTPTPMAFYELTSWEGEFVNFCDKSIKPPTVFEFMTDVCTTTATYTLQKPDTPFEGAPIATPASGGGPMDGMTVDKLESGMDDTSSASGATIRFLSIVAVGAVFMMW
eukprot:CAMPEP_0178700810 /NCGR_PEP_ID=MMETSP0699-20121125/11892_1 /TAXON_ID=265572 /ORGANISM="Extubocellulus spinifer, Strain CCMP396" /LENGTH=470 /DNA_ID=CAMNT_0020347209 /DNA_START=71 /DNA_END=1483 /DNA_ORIENTATION=+